jgi:hypothetical protein
MTAIDIGRTKLDVIPHRKRRGKVATVADLARITWDPWTREPGMKPGEMAPKDQTMRECGVLARMAYNVMLMTRDDLIAAIHKAPNLLLGMEKQFAETSQTLKEIAVMLDTAQMRVLAAGAAASEE